MSELLLFARLILVAVFAVAGWTKLADQEGSRKALIDFGLSPGLAPFFGIFLPFTELAIAAALILRPSVWWGAIGAVALLVLFIIATAVNLALGRKPDCHCFGQIHSTPVGWPTLVRNGLFVAVAGLIVWQGQENPGPTITGWLGTLSSTSIFGLVITAAFLALLAAAGWFSFHLLRQQGRLLLRIEALEQAINHNGAQRFPISVPPAAGLPVGAAAPAFSLPGLDGETVTLAALREAGKPVLLLFSDPSCGPCNALIPEVASWQQDHVSKVTIAPISRGTVDANRAEGTQSRLVHVLLQRDREVAESYQAHGTPAAVLVSSDGKIASPLALGVDAIRELVMRTVGRAPLIRLPLAVPAVNGNGATFPTLPAAVKVGDRAPVLKLPDLSGKPVNLADFLQRRSTLVLFWNPACGFCVQMLNDLKAWEANSPEGAPQLLVISTGTVAANRALGLRSLVVLDEDFQTGRTFGTIGTPSGVLIEEGKIASPLAVGASTVLALAWGEHDRSVSSSLFREGDFYGSEVA